MSGRDDVGSAFYGHGRLDSTHDAVDRAVDTQSLLDDLRVQRQTGEILEGQSGQVGTKNGLLFGKQFLGNIRTRGQTEQNPRDRGGRTVLTSHEQSNHHVSNLLVGNHLASLVFAVHQVPDHVRLAVFGLSLAAVASSLDDLHVCLGHLALSSVALAVLGERCPGKHEVDGGEAHVEIVVQVGEGAVELGADFLTLKRTTGGVDCQLGHGLGDVELTSITLEPVGVLEKVLCLGGNDGYVGAEGVGSQAKLDKLLLLHKLGVGAIVDDIGAKDGSGQGAVDFFGVDILELSVQDEVVALGTEADSRLLAEQNEGEDIAVLRTRESVVEAWGQGLLDAATDLFAAIEEELVGVNAVGDSAANEGHPVEDEWRLGTLATDGQQLRQNIEDNGESESCAGDDGHGEPDRLVAQMHRNGVSNSGQDSHCSLLRFEEENQVALLGGFDFGNYYCCP